MVIHLVFCAIKYESWVELSDNQNQRVSSVLPVTCYQLSEIPVRASGFCFGWTLRRNVKFLQQFSESCIGSINIFVNISFVSYSTDESKANYWGLQRHLRFWLRAKTESFPVRMYAPSVLFLSDGFTVLTHISCSPLWRHHTLYHKLCRRCAIRLEQKPLHNFFFLEERERRRKPLV